MENILLCSEFLTRKRMKGLLDLKTEADILVVRAFPCDSIWEALPPSPAPASLFERVWRKRPTERTSLWRKRPTPLVFSTLCRWFLCRRQAYDIFRRLLTDSQKQQIWMGDWKFSQGPHATNNTRRRHTLLIVSIPKFSECGAQLYKAFVRKSHQCKFKRWNISWWSPLQLKAEAQDTWRKLTVSKLDAASRRQFVERWAASNLTV